MRFSSHEKVLLVFIAALIIALGMLVLMADDAASSKIDHKLNTWLEAIPGSIIDLDIKYAGAGTMYTATSSTGATYIYMIGSGSHIPSSPISSDNESDKGFEGYYGGNNDREKERGHMSTSDWLNWGTEQGLTTDPSVDNRITTEEELTAVLSTLVGNWPDKDSGAPLTGPEMLVQRAIDIARAEEMTGMYEILATSLFLGYSNNPYGSFKTDLSNLTQYVEELAPDKIEDVKLLAQSMGYKLGSAYTVSKEIDYNDPRR